MLTLKQAVATKENLESHFLGDIGELPQGLSEAQNESKEKFGYYTVEKVCSLVYLIENYKEDYAYIAPECVAYGLGGLESYALPFGFYKVWYDANANIDLQRLWRVDPSHYRYLEAYDKVLKRAIAEGHIIKTKDKLVRAKNKGVYTLRNQGQFKATQEEQK